MLKGNILARQVWDLAVLPGTYFLGLTGESAEVNRQYTMFGFNMMSQPQNVASFSVAPWSFNRILIALSLPVPHSWVGLLPASLLRSYTFQPSPERFPVVGEMTTCTKVKLQMWKSDFFPLGENIASLQSQKIFSTGLRPKSTERSKFL